MKFGHIGVAQAINMSDNARSRALSFKAGHAIQVLLLSGLVYGFFMALAFLLSRLGVPDGVSLAIAHLGSFGALLTCWRYGKWGRARYDSFGAALLLVAAALRLFAMIDALIYGTRVEEMYRYRTLPVSDPVIDLLFKGEFITTLGLLLVACSWRWIVDEKVERFSFFGNAQRVPLKLAVGIYLAAMFVAIVSRELGVSFGPLEQLSSLLYGFGIAAIFFIGMHGRARSLQVVIAGLLAVPLSFFALRGGMKEEIFFPLIPAVLLYWIRFRSFAARGLALVLGFIILAGSQVFVHYVRDTTWGSAGDVGMSTSELVSEFGQQARQAKSLDAIDSINSRINLTITHATSVTLADNHGFEPVGIFGMIPGSLIPRLFWPGKPIMQPGLMQTSRILGESVPVSMIATATAAGFSTELYLGGWWFGVVLGCVAYGALLAWSQNWVWKNAPGFGHQALCFLVLYRTLRFDEIHIVYAFTTVIFTMIFVWMLNRVTRAFGFTPNSSVIATGK